MRLGQGEQVNLSCNLNAKTQQKMVTKIPGRHENGSPSLDQFPYKHLTVLCIPDGR